MADLVHRAVAADYPAAIEAPGVTVRVIDPGRLFFVGDGRPDLAPNERRGDGPYWLWLAPDRALLVGADAPPPGFASEVSDGLTAFAIGGKRAAALLAMGCTLDAEGAALAPGRCAQTVFAGVKALLHREAEAGGFRLFAERSLAPWLIAWFEQAAGALR